MKPEPELRRDIQQGDHAKRILDDPLIKEAIDGMRTTVFHNIQTSHYSKVEEREDLYKMLRAIDQFEKEFKRRIQGGTKAKSLLERLLNK